MQIIAKCMIRNKPDSYCQAHDVETRGISELVHDLIDLYALYGVHPAARPPQLGRAGTTPIKPRRPSAIAAWFVSILVKLGLRKA